MPAAGCVTASSKPVAIAASTAFPPAARTSAPALLAARFSDTTIPFGARTGPALSARTGEDPRALSQNAARAADQVRNLLSII